MRDLVACLSARCATSSRLRAGRQSSHLTFKPAMNPTPQREPSCLPDRRLFALRWQLASSGANNEKLPYRTKSKNDTKVLIFAHAFCSSREFGTGAAQRGVACALDRTTSALPRRRQSLPGKGDNQVRSSGVPSRPDRSNRRQIPHAGERETPAMEFPVVETTTRLAARSTGPQDV